MKMSQMKNKISKEGGETRKTKNEVIKARREAEVEAKKGIRIEEGRTMTTDST